MDQNYPKLPLYECHKGVAAAKITAVKPSGCDTKPCFLTVEADGAQVDVEVSAGFLRSQLPEVGGYLVADENGGTEYVTKAHFEALFDLLDCRQRLELRPDGVRVVELPEPAGEAAEKPSEHKAKKAQKTPGK
jgi:hypothetical protein